MKFRPILYNQFSAEANAKGIKTQTRRATGLKTINENPECWTPSKTWLKDGHITVEFLHTSGKTETVKCPYGIVGDGLWGREAWKPAGWDCQGEWSIEYRAGGELDISNGLYHDSADWEGDKENDFIQKLTDKIETTCEKDEDGNFMQPGDYMSWFPSLFMPKAACRQWEKITGLRVERLSDISEADAIAEGIEKSTNPMPLMQEGSETVIATLNYQFKYKKLVMVCDTAKNAYKKLLTEMHGKAFVKSNPWLWVITKETITKPAEQ